MTLKVTNKMTTLDKTTKINTPEEPAFTASAFHLKILMQAIANAFLKLDPRVLFRNPVMMVVELGSVLTTIAWLNDVYTRNYREASFSGSISIWLWFTILFANFAEAIAEGRGKAQADTLRKARKSTLAYKRLPSGAIETVASELLKKGDLVVVSEGQNIPGDGTVLEGAAVVDESAITGESAPVVREAGGDRSAVTGGTTVLSDKIVIQITQDPGKSFLDRMIALVEGASRSKTPNEIALSILLSGLTIIFLLAVVTLKPFAIYSGIHVSYVVLIALLVCLIPTTIGGLLSAIGIAGMDRLIKRNILAMSGRAVEAAGNIDVMILDKTGTITVGNRMATEFIPAPGVTLLDLSQAAYLASIADLTPEGRSIVKLAEKMGKQFPPSLTARNIPFSAETRMSGVEDQNLSLRKGAMDSVAAWLKETGSVLPGEIYSSVEHIAAAGGTPLVVAS
ncbi:MAG: potassium-transporting ATPase subunit KdpB, partial [Bdellovibrionia bacterium]